MGGGHSWREWRGGLKLARERGRRVELGRGKGGGVQSWRGGEREREGVSKLGRGGRGDHRWERERGGHRKGERGEGGQS